jgi:hypothetical protein
MSAASDAPPEIFVVSDGTGETALAALRAGLMQFQNTRWRVRTFRDVRHEARVKQVAEEAARVRALVVFTLVDAEVAGRMRALCDESGVAAIDLLGPLLGRLGQHLGALPGSKPGLLHGFSDDYYERVEAVEFAVRHDDGANLHTLHRAHLVLTGPSRTSKTPLTMYVAQRGYRTGNVPLIAGVPPPRELLELDRRKVFGLVVDPATLVSVRRARVRALGTTPYSSYADPDSVVEELREVRRLFRERAWTVVDISGRAVEENAARILELYESIHS